ncbi:hypothetical protein T484DRAFT_1848028, partial [Baffinella frigidus]
VTRTNCIDCLDRTNVCQYGLGRVAFAYQLCAHGVWTDPHGGSSETFSLESHVFGVLMQMYFLMGNSVAKQYAGTEAQKKTDAEAQKKTDAGSGTQAKIRSIFVSINRSLPPSPP